MPGFFVYGITPALWYRRLERQRGRAVSNGGEGADFHAIMPKPWRMAFGTDDGVGRSCGYCRPNRRSASMSAFCPSLTL